MTYVIFSPVAGGLAGALACTFAWAQIAPDAGSILREQQRPTLELPRPAPAIRVEEPARPALDPDAVVRFELKRLRITGNTVFSEAELLLLVQDVVGREVSFAELDAAAARISAYYRQRGYLVARAYLPAQRLQDGVAEIAVIEGRFGKVNLNNRSRVRDGVVAGYLAGLPGAPVSERSAERRLLLFNDLAGIGAARGNLSPGAAVGESDLTVEITPAPLINGSLEYDNAGNRFTGANRVTGRLNLASPLGVGDALSALYTKGFDGLDFGRIGYQLPLGGDGLKLGSAYTQARYRLGRNFANLNATGESDTVTLSVSYPFVRSANANLYGQAAYDWREFEDRVGSTATVVDRTTRAATFTLSGDARDTLLGGGVTVFSLAWNGGKLNIQSPGALAIDDATARANGHFGKWNGNVLRLQTLSERVSAYAALSTQMANKNLDSSEKFILGGPTGVRAYPLGEASGDLGYLATLELRYTVALAAVGTLQPFVFADAGAVTINKNPFAVQPNQRRLAGGGFGVMWSKPNDFMVKLTLASRIGKQPSLSSDTDRHVRGWVQAVKYF